jgi:hypothetical protein
MSKDKDIRNDLAFEIDLSDQPDELVRVQFYYEDAREPNVMTEYHPDKDAADQRIARLSEPGQLLGHVLSVRHYLLNED